MVSLLYLFESYKITNYIITLSYETKCIIMLIM